MPRPTVLGGGGDFMHITDCSSPHTERKLRPHTARPPLPAAIAIAIAIANAIAIAIATTGRAMPCRQLTGCILQGKKSKMSVFCRCMGLSHLAVGFRHYLVQRGLALVGSASHYTAQTISQMVVIHAAFHGASQVVQAASMFSLICVHPPTAWHLWIRLIECGQPLQNGLGKNPLAWFCIKQ